MAYIKKSKGRLTNPLLADVSGTIGKTYVYKQYKDKVVLANYPKKSKKKPTSQQKENRSSFQDAVEYARAILKDPKKKAAYTKKLKGKSNVYHAVISEYMKSNKKA